MDKCNIPPNAKYIGYKCVKCDKNIYEDERQIIISLGFVQTWCMNCTAIKYHNDKHLLNYVASGGANDVILDRNKLLNDL